LKQKTRKLDCEVAGRPVLYMSFCVVLAITWFIFSGYLFLAFLPQFNYYETVFVLNPGTNDYDVYFWWSWIPTLSILVFGIFWASGLLGNLWKTVR